MPVINFAAGGIATPADAALMMQLGVDGVFVGSGIFKSGNFDKRILEVLFMSNLFAENPLKTAQGIVAAVLHYNDAKILAEASENLGDAMKGIGNLKIVENFAEREGGNMKK